MSAASILTSSLAKGVVINDKAGPSDPIDEVLSQALKHVHEIVPPLWPLADYVAVNPVWG